MYSVPNSGYPPRRRSSNIGKIAAAIVVVIVIVFIVMQNSKNEVYLIKAADDKYHPYSWWQPYINKYNIKLATPKQLEKAHKNGAHWFHWGFLSDQGRGYPLNVSVGDGRFPAGVSIRGFSPSYEAGLNVYGIKPKQSEVRTMYPDANLVVAPFNSTTGQWSRLDKS